jgi:hypothetical protein
MKITDYAARRPTLTEIPDNAIFDATLPGVRCLVCGATRGMYLPMGARLVAKILREFSTAHQGCQREGGAG